MKTNEIPTADLAQTVALTLSPSPATNALLSKGDIALRCSELLNMIAHYFYSIRTDIEVKGTWELGLQKKLHTHMKLTLLTDHAKIEFWRVIRYRLERLGFIAIKTDVNEGWDTYIGKETDYMHTLGVLPYSTRDMYDTWTVNYNLLALRKKQKKKVKYPKPEADTRPLHYKITDYALEWKESESDSNSIDDDQLIYHGRLMDELCSPSRRGVYPPAR